MDSIKGVWSGFRWDMLGFGACRAAYLCCFVYLSSCSPVEHGLFLYWITATVFACAPLVVARVIRRHGIARTQNRTDTPGSSLPHNNTSLTSVNFSDRQHTGIIITAALLFIGGVAAMLLANTYSAYWLFLAGIISAGAGSGLLYVLWGIKLSMFNDNAIITYVACGFALAALTMICVNAVSGSAGIAALFMGMVALFSLNGHWSPSIRQDTPTQPATGILVEYAQGYRALSSVSRGMFARLGVMMGIVPFAYTLAVMTFINTSIFNRDIEGVIVAVLAIAFIIIIKRISLMDLLRLTLPVIVASYLFMRILPPAFNDVLVVIAGSGIKLAELFIWIVIGSIAHSHQDKKWFIASVGAFATFGGRALAYITALFFLNQPWYSPTLVTYLLVVLLIVAVILMLPLSQRQNQQAANTPMQEPASSEEALEPYEVVPANTASLGETCDRVASSYSLTNREEDVLLLLAQGRSKGVIAEKLGISEGTVHAHIIHVYQKLGVHSQQELISFMEEKELGGVEDNAESDSNAHGKTITLEL